jgi:hypothetical protein
LLCKGGFLIGTMIDAPCLFQKAKTITWQEDQRDTNGNSIGNNSTTKRQHTSLVYYSSEFCIHLQDDVPRSGLPYDYIIPNRTDKNVTITGGRRLIMTPSVEEIDKTVNSNNQEITSNILEKSTSMEKTTNNTSKTQQEKESMQVSREYLLFMNHLISLAHFHGFQLLRQENMASYASEELNNPRNQKILEHMKIQNLYITPETWNTVGLYKVFVFMKIN